MRVADIVGAEHEFRHPALFLSGHDVVYRDAEVVSDARPSATSSGGILSFGDDGDVDIQLADGVVRLRGCHLRDQRTDAGEHPSLKTFVTEVGLPLPYALSATRYPNITDINRYESTSRWYRLRHQAPEIVDDAALQLLSKNGDFFRYLTRSLGLPSGGRALDIGCGMGWATQGLADVGLHAEGCDLDEQILERARVLFPSVNFWRADVLDLPSAGGYDFLFCRGLGIAQKVDVLSEQWLTAVQRMVQLLTSGGVLYWVQYGNTRGRTTEDGFTNPSVEHMVKMFSSFGDVAWVNYFAYQSYIVTTKGQGPRLQARLSDFYRHQDRSILSGWLLGAPDGRVHQCDAARVCFRRCGPYFVAGASRYPAGLHIEGPTEIVRLQKLAADRIGIPVSDQRNGAMLIDHSDVDDRVPVEGDGTPYLLSGDQDQSACGADYWALRT